MVKLPIYAKSPYIYLNMHIYVLHMEFWYLMYRFGLIALCFSESSKDPAFQPQHPAFGPSGATAFGPSGATFGPSGATSWVGSSTWATSVFGTAAGTGESTPWTAAEWGLPSWILYAADIIASSTRTMDIYFSLYIFMYIYTTNIYASFMYTYNHLYIHISIYYTNAKKVLYTKLPTVKQSVAPGWPELSPCRSVGARGSTSSNGSMWHRVPKVGSGIVVLLIEKNVCNQLEMVNFRLKSGFFIITKSYSSTIARHGTRITKSQKPPLRGIPVGTKKSANSA